MPIAEQKAKEAIVKALVIAGANGETITEHQRSDGFLIRLPKGNGLDTLLFYSREGRRLVCAEERILNRDIVGSASVAVRQPEGDFIRGDPGEWAVDHARRTGYVPEVE